MSHALEMNENKLIGQLVLGLDFGVGTIVGVERLQKGGEDFIVVKKQNESMKTYYPLDGKDNFRFPSSKETITRAIKNFQDYSNSTVFESARERINYFKKAARKQNTEHLFLVFAQLKSLEKLGDAETKILQKLTKSLLAEMSMVLELPANELKQILDIPEA